MNIMLNIVLCNSVTEIMEKKINSQIIPSFPSFNAFGFQCYAAQHLQVVIVVRRI